MRCSVEGCKYASKLNVANVHLCRRHFNAIRETPRHEKSTWRKWTKAEDERLLACEITPHHKRMEGERSELHRLAEELGRGYFACCERLTILRGKPKPQLGTLEGLWTEAEDKIVRDNIGWPRTPVGVWDEVAADLGRTKSAVVGRAVQLRREMLESALDE